MYLDQKGRPVNYQSHIEWVLAGCIKILIAMEGIYFILKPFGGDITLVFASTAMRGDHNCDQIRRKKRRRHSWKNWEVLKDRIGRSGIR